MPGRIVVKPIVGKAFETINGNKAQIIGAIKYHGVQLRYIAILNHFVHGETVAYYDEEGCINENIDGYYNPSHRETYNLKSPWSELAKADDFFAVVHKESGKVFRVFQLQRTAENVLPYIARKVNLYDDELNVVPVSIKERRNV